LVRSFSSLVQRRPPVRRTASETWKVAWPNTAQEVFSWIRVVGATKPGSVNTSSSEEK